MRAKLLPLMLPLALAGIAQPATAQNSTACANEAQRLSDGIPLSGSPSAIGAQQPGSRIDAGMTADQQSRARNLIQQARTAAQQGDTATCMQRLSNARIMLRESGVGPRPRPSSNPVPSATDQVRPTAGREPLTGEPAETDGVSTLTAPAARMRGTLGSETPSDSGPGLPTTGGARDSARDGIQDRVTSPQGAEAPRSATPARRSTRPSAVDSGSGGSRATTSSGGRSSTGSSSGGGR